jgi:hypothetical protein
MVPHFRRRPVILLTILFALLVTVGILHHRILQAAARVVIVDQSAREFDCLCLLPDMGVHVEGDDACQTVARLCRQMQSPRVLLIEPPSSRLVQVKAMPSFRTTMEKEFQRYGIPWNAVELLPITADCDLPKAEAVAAWLKRNPQSRVQILCDQFSTRQYRWLLDSCLTPADAQRVSLRPLPRQEFNETNWWRERGGIRDLIFGYLTLAYAWSGWRDCEAEPPADPDTYERRFLDGLQEAKTR